MSLKERMHEATEKWEDDITGLQVKIKELERLKEYETDENKREEISKKIEEKTKRMIFCKQRFTECEAS